MQHKSFKDKFFNKKGLLIFIIALILVGVGIGGAFLKVSSYPAFCNTCHIMKPYYESWHDNNLNFVASKHANEDVDCHDCHKPNLITQMNEGYLFITRQYQDPLEKREFAKDMCFECHIEGGTATSWEEIKSATEYEESNPHDSHHGEQECYICHNQHQKQQIFCADCHIFNWIDDLDDNWETSW
ncbi:MAG TPA: cytochrome c3 family protein [Syntrophomonadaceae bacterium]|nr:cytochrome c3 family protein [Syntrophomonadaceae bacterium]